MEYNENSVLILDTKNDYDQAFFNHDDLRIIGIEKNCEESLNTIEKSKPEFLVKVINDEDGLTLRDTVNYINNVKQISEDTQLLIIADELSRLCVVLSHSLRIKEPPFAG
jgi:hypothetical protein